MTPLEHQRAALREEFTRRGWLISTLKDDAVLVLRSCTVKTDARRVNKTTCDVNQPISVIIPSSCLANPITESIATYRNGATTGINTIVQRVAYLEDVGKRALDVLRKNNEYNYQLRVTPSICDWFTVSLSGIVVTRDQLQQLSSLLDTFKALD